ncbi:MAG: ATP-binding cassette domain-containing protein [Chloroflexota bacterium]
MQSLAIETHQLSRRFGSITAVNDINLAVRRGTVYGFLGPNGAGKTTTIRMLLGLIQPNAGRICLLDKPLRRNDRSPLRRVGALVEAPSLYGHLTGRENLEVTRRLLGAPREQISRVLDIVRLQDVADRRVSQYSLGMKQRLALALTLLGEPELLILDEPTNGLDPAGIHEIRDLIREFPRRYGITVFLSSHLLSEVEQVADAIGIIHRGRLMFQGSLDELRALREPHLAVGVDQTEAALGLLREAGYVVQGSPNGVIHVDANNATDAAELNRYLVTRGVAVHHLSLQQRSLEDIFLSLTGESHA